MPRPPTPTPTPEDAARLAARFLPLFRELAGRPIPFRGGGEESPGVIRLAYPELDGRVYGFLDACMEEGFVYSFDWPAFADRARELVEAPEALAGASLEALRRVLIVLVRQDRFGGGVLAEAVERGVLLRVLERMAALAPR